MNARYYRGLNRLHEIDGEQIAKLLGGLEGIAPDFAGYVVEFAFGDIYARPGLDLRGRQIATLAALTVLGTAGPQLKGHLGASLKAGLSREEIIEVIIQMALYGGFPAALNGLAAAKEVFAEIDRAAPEATARRPGLAGKEAGGAL